MRPNRALDPSPPMTRHGVLTGSPASRSRRQRRRIMAPPCCADREQGDRVTRVPAETVIPAMPQCRYPLSRLLHSAGLDAGTAGADFPTGPVHHRLPLRDRNRGCAGDERTLVIIEQPPESPEPNLCRRRRFTAGRRVAPPVPKPNFNSQCYNPIRRKPPNRTH